MTQHPNLLEEIFVVYWSPGARELGSFPSTEEAEDFISQVIQLNLCTDQNPNEMRSEFNINALPFRPNPSNIEL